MTAASSPPLSVPRPPPSPDSAAKIARPAKIPTQAIHLWHRRIGHINYQSLYHMTSRKLIAGVPAIPLIKHICASCALGKHARGTIPKTSATTTTHQLQLIHNNLCGPMPIISKTGNRYILTFIDDFSCKTWVYFLAEKSQTLAFFKQFRTLVETPTLHITALCSGRGVNTHPQSSTPTVANTE